MAVNSLALSWIHLKAWRIHATKDEFLLIYMNLQQTNVNSLGLNWEFSLKVSEFPWSQWIHDSCYEFTQSCWEFKWRRVNSGPIAMNSHCEKWIFPHIYVFIMSQCEFRQNDMVNSPHVHGFTLGKHEFPSWSVSPNHEFMPRSVATSGDLSFSMCDFTYDFTLNSPFTPMDSHIENLTVLYRTFEWGNSQRIIAILPGVFGGPTAKLPSCQTDIGASAH